MKYTEPLQSIPAWQEVFHYIDIDRFPELNVLAPRYNINLRLGWADLASSERTFLRFAWEVINREECPYPLYCHD